MNDLNWTQIDLSIKIRINPKLKSGEEKQPEDHLQFNYHLLGFWKQGEKSFFKYVWLNQILYSNICKTFSIAYTQNRLITVCSLFLDFDLCKLVYLKK